MAIWHGTKAEERDLNGACNHNCRALTEPDQGCGELCEAHGMLSKQRILDGLLWARRSLDLLRAEEFRVLPPKEAQAWAKSQRN